MCHWQIRGFLVLSFICVPICGFTFFCRPLFFPSNFTIFFYDCGSSSNDAEITLSSEHATDQPKQSLLCCSVEFECTFDLFNCLFTLSKCSPSGDDHLQAFFFLIKMKLIRPLNGVSPRESMGTCAATVKVLIKFSEKVDAM